MSLAIRQGLYNALSGSSALKAKVGERIYHEQAPGGADFPYVIYSKASGVKIRVLKKGSQLVRDTYLVKAVDRDSSSKRADEVADVIDALLDEESFTVSGKTVLDLYHVGDVEYVENSGDKSYRHSGANYGVVVS